MRSSLQGRDRVAIGTELARPAFRPCDGPFRAPAAVERGLAGERTLADQYRVGKRVPEIVGKTARKAERFLGRHFGAHAAAVLGASPADFHALRQIGLGSRERIKPLGAKRCRIAEDFRIGVEPDGRAAPFPGAAPVLERARGHAAAVGLRPERAVARDLDRHPVAERVDDRNADTVQPARRLIDIAAELASRVERGEHNLQCGFVGKFRMRIDRNAAPVVADGDRAVGFEREIDPCRVPGDDLVHRVVEHFRRQMVESRLVGAADIHAGPPAYRLKAFEDFDVPCRVTFGPGRGFGGGARHRSGECETDQVSGKRRIW